MTIDAEMSPRKREEIRRSVMRKYQAVAEHPSGHFPYPVGRESALGLGYDRAWVDAVPSEIVHRFVGVGNPFSLSRPRPGARVLDVGCGCGFDTYVASLLVGSGGRATGIDLTREMLDRAARPLESWRPRNVGFRQGSAEDLPFAPESFDLVISNGVLNLIPDKDRAYGELHRVLRPGGTLAAADLFVTEAIPDEVLADQDAWST